jgi:hypothetical protein
MQEFVRLHPFDEELKRFLSGKDISIFSTPTWNEVLQKGFHINAWYYCLKEGGQIVLSLPGVLLDFKLIKVFYANMPYGEFVGDMRYIPSFLNLLEDHLKKEKVHLIRIAQLGDQSSRWMRDFHPRKGYQHILDLNGMEEDTLWKTYKPALRRNIKKAENSGVTIKEIGKKDEMKELFRLYLETMKRNHATPTWTQGVFDAIYNLLAGHGQASIFFAVWEGRIIAGLILINSENIASYFLGASGTSFHSLRPNDLLFHQAILRSLLGGKKKFDFMTSVEVDEELIRFKEKWGAKRYPFVIYEKELNAFRAKIWTDLWKIANSNVGSNIVRFLIGHFRSY